MTPGRLLGRLLLRSGEGRPLQRVRPWLLMLDQFLYSSADQTRSAPHVRGFTSVQGLLNDFVIATIPCWLIGLWSLGHQSNMVVAELNLATLPGWRGEMIGALGIGHDPGNIAACFFLGLSYFLPVFLVALLAGWTWEAIFSTVRRRPLSEGLLAFAWLFALVMPAGVGLYQVGLGVSFGFVVGGAIYGGSGRYLVNPALLGFTFLLFAYPDEAFGPANWIPVPGAETIPALKVAADGGIAALQSAGFSWWDLFLGVRPGPLGAVSVLGCLLGAVYLMMKDSASWRIMLGALMGLWFGLMLFNGFESETNALAAAPWGWHLVLGGFAFGVIFFATDPVAAAMTLPGRWAFGILVGVLTITIRLASPSNIQAVLLAVLLASLFSPVIDFAVIELNIRRRRRRLMVRSP